MIIDKEVTVKVTKKTIDHYKDLYNNINLGDEIVIDPNHLTKGSSLKVNVKCDICSEERYIAYQAYFININKCRNWPIYTCDKCSHVKIKDYNMEKYGVEYYSKTNEYNTKFKNTMMSRYGVEHALQSLDFKSKTMETNLNKFGFENPFMNRDLVKSGFKKKWGYDHPSQVPEIKSKIKETMLSRYGVEYSTQNEVIMKKVNSTNILKYGGHPMKNDEVRYINCLIARDKDYISYLGENKSEFNCDLGKGHIFIIDSELYHNRLRSGIPLCTICNELGDSSSIKQKDLLSYISSKYSGQIINNWRDGLEIDIYLPELKLGFEFNGLYWHSEEYKDRNYHLDKLEYFQKRGIRIVNIWEDDWVDKNSIIKSQIDNLLGKSQKIYARKCNIREIYDVSIIKEFLNKNHIQGWVSSTIKLGLYYGDELVSIMIFDHFEGRKKMNLDEWNLSRFCNKLGSTIIGGASKLLSFFIKQYKPKKIISYADRNWSIGTLYNKLNFIEIEITKPDYKYVIRNKRIHKSKFRKSNLDTNLSESKFMKSNGIKKIWDCGKIKFSFLIENNP